MVMRCRCGDMGSAVDEPGLAGAEWGAESGDRALLTTHSRVSYLQQVTHWQCYLDCCFECLTGLG